MARNVKQAIQELLDRSGTVSSGELAEALGVSRQAAYLHLRKAVERGELVREGAGRGAHYRRPAAVSETGAKPARRRYRFATSGLAEDRAWAEVAAADPALRDLSGEAAHVYEYAFTELVNNAIDHSGAAEVEVVVESGSGTVSLEILDRGVGIFEHVRDELGLATPLEALQELSKGKTTTMPDRHTGEGLFFVSKAARWFAIESGRLGWMIDNARSDMAVTELESPRPGTWVRFEAEPASVRPLAALFDEYTDDFEFSRTRTRIELFAIGVRFVSRSEAKRLMHNLERFREVILDFTGVDGVGQGFADEVFRVWARAHPEVRLMPVHMNQPVRMMVERARAAR